ncbi:phosphotransferase [Bacillus sp. AK031]
MDRDHSVCRDLTTMILKTNEKGGDGFQNRLLLLLKKKLRDNDIDLQKIKDGKWMLQTSTARWFVKLYPSEKKYLLQKKVIGEMRARGFMKVPAFHALHEEEIVEFGGRIIGITDWVEPGKAFTYNTFQERQAALSVLKEFHSCSKKLLLNNAIKETKTALPRQALIKKWRIRLEEFRKNAQVLSHYVPFSCIAPYIQLGEDALDGVIRHGFSECNCLLHGDLAHHNFLLDEKNQLYIIDFDLISSGPEEIDYIQFANRIFPYIHWSLESLWKHRAFEDYKNDKGFLSALLYPSDVFREWNRFFREGPNYQRRVWDYLMALTVGQFSERMAYSSEIKKKLRE